MHFSISAFQVEQRIIFFIVFFKNSFLKIHCFYIAQISIENFRWFKSSLLKKLKKENPIRKIVLLVLKRVESVKKVETPSILDSFSLVLKSQVNFKSFQRE
jgi:hypothetical protein